MAFATVRHRHFRHRSLVERTSEDIDDGGGIFIGRPGDQATFLRLQILPGRLVEGRALRRDIGEDVGVVGEHRAGEGRQRGLVTAIDVEGVGRAIVVAGFERLVSAEPRVRLPAASSDRPTLSGVTRYATQSANLVRSFEDRV